MPFIQCFNIICGQKTMNNHDGDINELHFVFEILTHHHLYIEYLIIREIFQSKPVN